MSCKWGSLVGRLAALELGVAVEVGGVGRIAAACWLGPHALLARARLVTENAIRRTAQFAGFVRKTMSLAIRDRRSRQWTI
jgi:hypothetical protein